MKLRLTLFHLRSSYNWGFISDLIFILRQHQVQYKSGTVPTGAACTQLGVGNTCHYYKYSRQARSAMASLSLAMIITAAAWSLIIVFIHLLFHGSKITIYFDEDDEVRKNSSQYVNENVFPVIENWRLAFPWLWDQC